MKSPELFHKTVGILVKAYQNETLQHDHCACCAVGNIIVSNCGFKNVNFGKESLWQKGNKIYDPEEWINVFGTSYKGIEVFGFKFRISQDNWFIPERATGNVKSWAKQTGYSLIELAQIEHAFESVKYSRNTDKYMFDGLMAVVDTLMLIHEATEIESQQAKELFTLTA